MKNVKITYHIYPDGKIDVKHQGVLGDSFVVFGGGGHGILVMSYKL